MSVWKKVLNVASKKAIRKKLGLTGAKVKSKLGLRYRPQNQSSALGWSNVGSTGFRRYV